MSAEHRIEGLLRELAPQVLGTLVRRYGQFDACEDAVQEALLAAVLHWPAEGVPDRPRSWLLTVAVRALIDEWRSESARRRREERVARTVREPAAGGDLAARGDPIDGGDLAAGEGRADGGDLAARGGDVAVGGDPVAAGGDLAVGSDLAADPPGAGDRPGHREEGDTLALLFLCCHPALSPASQLALTLRAVGGLTTAEIAAAFLVPEATMAQRISRAKQRIKTAGARFELPPEPERAERLGVVLHVLYLVFNEGYTSSAGAALHRADLTAEAIRLVRLLRRLVPGEAEVAGLLALMLLTDARRAARTDDDGAIVPLAEQRRELWDTAAIAEGLALLTSSLGTGPIGPYQLQAAIAAVHDEARSAEETDWPQILALYEVLARVAPGPLVTLSRAVAVAMVHGPRAGLALLGTLDADGRMAHTHRLDAVRAHLLESAGDTAAARESYLRAARMTANAPEQRYLALRAARLRHLSSREGPEVTRGAEQPDKP
jgi:RNA polymerase sigma factor (sigma-70 family)